MKSMPYRFLLDHPVLYHICLHVFIGAPDGEWESPPPPPPDFFFFFPVGYLFSFIFYFYGDRFKCDFFSSSFYGGGGGTDAYMFVLIPNQVYGELQCLNSDTPL